MRGRSSIQITIEAPGKVVIAEVKLAPLKSTQVVVRILNSLISNGSERICFTGKFKANSHWGNWISYPFKPGYAAIGQIERIGSEVTHDLLGKRVAVRSSHSSLAIEESNKVYPVPDSLNSNEAAWFAIAKIVLVGLRKVKIGSESNVFVIGAGPIGQMALRWAAVHKPKSITVIDRNDYRLKFARDGGATATVVSASEINASDSAIVIDCSGSIHGLDVAVKCCGRMSELVILGDIADEAASLRIAPLMIKGVTVHFAHDSNVKRGLPEHEIVNYFFSCLESERIVLSKLNSHVFSPYDCNKVYHLLNKRGAKMMGILLDWTTAQ